MLRSMHSADNALARCLSVSPSQCRIVSKRLNISLKFFHHLHSRIQFNRRSEMHPQRGCK